MDIIKRMSDRLVEIELISFNSGAWHVVVLTLYTLNVHVGAVDEHYNTHVD